MNSIPEEKIVELSDLVFRGQKIQAIKLHRDLTGSGLKEAKEAVEELEASLRATSPEKFSAARGKGCTGAAAMLALGITVFVYVVTRV